MIKSILKYAGKYKILTVVATVMVVIAVAAQILPYIFAYQIISPLIAGESIPWQYAVAEVVGVAVCLVLNSCSTSAGCPSRTLRRSTRCTICA